LFSAAPWPVALPWAFSAPPMRMASPLKISACSRLLISVAPMSTLKRPAMVAEEATPPTVSASLLTWPAPMATESP
jgi:hypothetical protein